MIRIERVPMPDGLRALARRGPEGDLVIYVSSTLDARRQRTAVMAAIHAWRRAGWRSAAPLGVALLLALRLAAGGTARALRQRAALALHARPVAWVAGGTAVAAGAVATGLILTAPGHHLHSAGADPAAAPPAAGRSGQPRTAPGHRRRAHPAAGIAPSATVLAGQPQAAGHSLTAGSPGAVASAPPSAPAPAPAPSAAPTPTPTPTSAPSPPATTGAPGSCVIVLGVRVCVPVSVPVSVSASVGL